METELTVESETEQAIDKEPELQELVIHIDSISISKDGFYYEAQMTTGL